MRHAHLVDVASTHLDRSGTFRAGAPAWKRAVLPILGIACFVLPLGSTAALVAGVVVTLLGLNAYEGRTGAIAKRLLGLAVIGLGAGLDLRDVLEVGRVGACLAIASIAFTLSLGWILARALRVDSITGWLVTAGTAICGGSAIAATAPTLGAREHHTVAALGTVFLLNAVALLLFPMVGHAVGLSEDAFGLWAAVAIHDTSSVVGAAMIYGERALEVATTVKLTRALFIVPLTLALGAYRARRVRGADAGTCARPQFPWFIAAFVALALIVTMVPALRPAGELIDQGARRLMVTTLFLIGASLSPAALRRVGWRPLLLGVALFVATSITSLGAIVAAGAWIPG